MAAGAPLAPNRVLELDGQGAYVELPVAAFASLRQATLEAWVRWDEWGCLLPVVRVLGLAIARRHVEPMGGRSAGQRGGTCGS